MIENDLELQMDNEGPTEEELLAAETEAEDVDLDYGDELMDLDIEEDESEGDEELLDLGDELQVPLSEGELLIQNLKDDEIPPEDLFDKKNGGDTELLEDDEDWQDGDSSMDASMMQMGGGLDMNIMEGNEFGDDNLMGMGDDDMNMGDGMGFL